MVADDDGLNGTRLTLAIAKSLTYLIFIHDPDFFEINYKPTFPSILKTVNPEADFNHVYNLGLTEVRKIKQRWSIGCFSLDGQIIKNVYRIVRKQHTFQYWHHSFNHLTLKVHELDLPNNPCNPDKDYKFRSCLKVLLLCTKGIFVLTSNILEYISTSLWRWIMLIFNP